MNPVFIPVGLLLILIAPLLHADSTNVQSDPNAPVSTVLMGAEHEIPAEIIPTAGAQIYGVMFSRLMGDVRVVAFDGSKVLGVGWNNSPNNIGLFGAPIGSYTGSNFKFRIETLDNGKWTPVSTPMAVVSATCAYGDQKTLYDLLNLRFGLNQNKPDVRLLLSWVAPDVVLTTEAKHNPHNFIVVQEVTNYAKAYLTLNGQPYPAKVISVRMVYNGNLPGSGATSTGDPFDPSKWGKHTPDFSGANGSSGVPLPANRVGADPFPYSGNLSKTANDIDQITVGDQNHSSGFPTATNVTSDFLVEGAVVLMDGRTAYSTANSAN